MLTLTQNLRSISITGRQSQKQQRNWSCDTHSQKRAIAVCMPKVSLSLLCIYSTKDDWAVLPTSVNVKSNNPHYKPTGQPGEDHLSVRVSSQVILNCVKLSIKT